MKDNCFELEKNASRRPQGWKSSLGSETGNIAVDDEEENEEFILLGIDEELDDEEETEVVCLGEQEEEDPEDPEDQSCQITFTLVNLKAQTLKRDAVVSKFRPSKLAEKTLDVV